MKWVEWKWWRNVGCYLIPTCARCLKPFATPLCKDCENDCAIMTKNSIIIANIKCYAGKKKCLIGSTNSTNR